jgi:hypothetical protein
MVDVVKDAFASTLVFYDRFRRSKLTPTDLAKIAKKYSGKPQQLLSDLEKKYSISIPRECRTNEIERICKQYSVPKSYMALLPQRFSYSTYAYDPALDICSATFNAEKALLSRRIIAPNTSLMPLDNLTKVRRFIKEPGRQYCDTTISSVCEYDVVVS